MRHGIPPVESTAVAGYNTNINHTSALTLMTDEMRMLAACVAIAVAAMGPPTPAWSAPISVASSKDGALLPVQVDAAQGKILFTLPAPDRDGVCGRFLYTTKVREGLGSTDIRFDRGMMGKTQMLSFRRIGNKVAVIFENPRFRAAGGTPEEEKGVTSSFAFVTAALLDVTATLPGGNLVVNLAPFVGSDVMNVAQMLNAGEAGGFPEGTHLAAGSGFKLVESASTADPASVRVFPDHIELDALQTFQGDKPGPEIAAISPDARRVSGGRRLSMQRASLTASRQRFCPRTASRTRTAAGPMIRCV